MKIIVINKFQMSKGDFTFIKSQLKDKKLKVKDIAKECGVSRQRLYDTLTGKGCCPEKVIKVLKTHEIVIPYCDFYYEELKNGL